MPTMRAYRGFAGEAEPRLVEMEVPEVGPDDVLMKVEAAGLTAGTFTLLRIGMLRPMPMTLGHEGAGVVEAVGVNVTSVRAGDRVRVHPTLSCGHCRYCLTNRDFMCAGGAMMGFVAFGTPIAAYDRYHNGFIANYALAPKGQVDLLADEVSFDAGAKVHYLGNALRNLRAAELPPAASLGILGATGSMAVATVKLAPFFGVGRIVLVGRNAKRLQEVAALSEIPCDIVATETLGDDWANTGGLAGHMREVAPRGLDAIIDYLPSGGDMWQAVTGGLATGGTLVNMGGAAEPFSAPMRTLVARCWRIVGTRNHSRLDALEALRLLNEGRISIDDLITHRRPLEEVDQAVTQLQSRDEPVWMSVVNP